MYCGKIHHVWVSQWDLVIFYLGERKHQYSLVNIVPGPHSLWDTGCTVAWADLVIPYHGESKHQGGSVDIVSASHSWWDAGCTMAWADLIISYCEERKPHCSLIGIKFVPHSLWDAGCTMVWVDLVIFYPSWRKLQSSLMNIESEPHSLWDAGCTMVWADLVIPYLGESKYKALQATLALVSSFIYICSLFPLQFSKFSILFHFMGINNDWGGSVCMWHAQYCTTSNSDSETLIGSAQIFTHNRQCQIWQSHKCICNTFVMFKYGNWFAMAANSFKILKFVITFVHNTNVKHKFRICQEYTSEALVDNKNLHARGITMLINFATTLTWWNRLNKPHPFVDKKNVLNWVKMPKRIEDEQFYWLKQNETRKDPFAPQDSILHQLIDII